MKYLSVCSGIEAASVAWHNLGWKPVAFSEIEKFPSAVLAHQYPSVPNVGDMTKFNEWNFDEKINLLVGGTPCQSFSVAGLRKGLEDPRGNLALTYVGILDKFRPQWFVWENVPGVLSSNGGRDFGSFLGALVELGYGFAYRVLDAQYFGVAQRRRRVFVVGYLGDWRPAAEVLFEPESLRGNPAPSRKQGQEVTGTIAARFGISRNNHEECVATFDRQSSGAYGTAPVASTVSARDYKSASDLISQPVYMGNAEGGAQEVPFLTCHNLGGTAGISNQTPLVGQPVSTARMVSFGEYKDDGTASTMKQRDYKDATDLVAYGIPGNWIGRKPENGGNATEPIPFGVGEEPDTAHCLRSGASKADKHESTTYIAQPIPFDTTQITSPLNYSSPKAGDPCHPLAAGAHIPSIATNMAVRRLTPVECERLQGFPDNYTNIPWRKAVESPDGPRYKALGNSMAVPVMSWIGKRIEEYEQQAHKSPAHTSGSGKVLTLLSM